MAAAQTDRLPFVTVDLDAIRQNTLVAAGWCRQVGITLVGITKAAPLPSVATAMQLGGAAALGDSRLDNLHTIASVARGAPLHLIRSPGPSQAEQTIRVAQVSLNADLAALQALNRAAAAAGTQHDAILMIEVGDRREGVPPEAAAEIARAIEAMPGLHLAGLGASIGCRYTIYAQRSQLDLFAATVQHVSQNLGRPLDVCSLGGTVTLPNLLRGEFPPEITHLRIGEALLLGEDGAGEQPLPGMRQDAFCLHAEVIEVRRRQGEPTHALLALGYQDVEPTTMRATKPGIVAVDATSDHTVLTVDETLTPIQTGDILRFIPDYRGLVRLMSATDVAKRISPQKIRHAMQNGG